MDHDPCFRIAFGMTVPAYMGPFVHYNDMMTALGEGAGNNGPAQSGADYAKSHDSSVFPPVPGNRIFSRAAQFDRGIHWLTPLNGFWKNITGHPVPRRMARG
ncbi:hypothetical protein JCM25156A_13110 [Komagataeibacter kakiaceti JCM 25156]